MKTPGAWWREIVWLVVQVISSKGVPSWREPIMAIVAIAMAPQKLSEASADIFISRICSLLEAKEIRSIVPASTAQLRHLLLKSCRNASQAENLIRQRF